MTKKQEIIVIAFGVIVLIGIVVGVATRRNEAPAGVGTSTPNPTSTASSLNVTPAKPYSPEIPKGATETIPAQSIPIVNQPNAAPGAKFGVFHIAVDSNGYSPSSITVKKGDTVEINLEAQDGKYDIFSGSAGFYASASPGKPGKVSFQIGVAGVFIFNCRDLCPAGKIIQGSLIVLP